MRVASMFALLLIGIVACLLIGSTALAIFILIGPPLGGEAHGLIFIARLVAFVGFVGSPAEQLYRRYRQINASQIPAFPHGVRHLLFCASIIFCGVLSLIPVYLMVRAIVGPDPLVFLLTALATLGAAHWTYIWWDRHFPFLAINCLRRGRALQSLKQVRKKLAKPVFAGEQKLPWGGADVPESQLAHFCIVGTSGSGKTATIVEMMRTVLPRIRPGSDHRAIVYDAKRDMLSILAAVGVPNDHIRMLNPFDQRSFAWDIAADITTPALARQAAANFIRSAEGPNKYFTDAARAILAGTIEALGKIAPQQWTLRDVFYFSERRERLRSLFAHVGAHALIDQFFEPEQTFQSVRSTIAAELSLLEPIAALWAHTPPSRRFSLRDWLRSESVLVLGTDETVTAAMQAVNRVFVDRLGSMPFLVEIANDSVHHATFA